MLAFARLFAAGAGPLRDKLAAMDPCVLFGLWIVLNLVGAVTWGRVAWSERGRRRAGAATLAAFFLASASAVGVALAVGINIDGLVWRCFR